MSNDEILTVKETAALLKTTRQQVRKMIANEELPAFWSVGYRAQIGAEMTRFVLLPPFARRIFHCLSAPPALILFWAKSGSGFLRRRFSRREYHFQAYPIQRECRSHRKREHRSFVCP